MRRRILFSDLPVVRLGHPPLPYLTVSIPRPLLSAEAPTLMASATGGKHQVICDRETGDLPNE